MKKLMVFLSLVIAIQSLNAQKTLTLSKDLLKDKIKAGWAGQTIAVTFGVA